MRLGVGWDKFFTEAYYRKEQPIWESYAPGLFSDAGTDKTILSRLIVFTISLAAVLVTLIAVFVSKRRW